jgi:mRNA interferase MazF
VALVTPRRFDVWLVALDPTVGSEIQKTRPALVVSPDVMNQRLRTVIVAPMTTAEKPWPSRVAVRFGGQSGQIALDQIRTVDRARLVKRVGAVDEATGRAVCGRLAEMFGW